MENPLGGSKCRKENFDFIRPELLLSELPGSNRKKSGLEISNLPENWLDCSSNNHRKQNSSSWRDSAGGSAKKSGRNREFQAILPRFAVKFSTLKKASMDKILANEEITSLFTANRNGLWS